MDNPKKKPNRRVKALIGLFLFARKAVGFVSITSQELLDKVNQAISDVLDGKIVKEYQLGDLRVQKDSLPELYTLRNKLMREISAGNTTRVYVEFDNR